MTNYTNYLSSLLKIKLLRKVNNKVTHNVALTRYKSRNGVSLTARIKSLTTKFGTRELGTAG